MKGRAGSEVWPVRARPGRGRYRLRLKAEERARLPGIALDRIGRTPGGRAMWLLAFAMRDLRTMTPGDWDNLRWELQSFVKLPADRLQAHVEIPAPRDGEIKRWQNWLSTNLKRLVQGAEWRIAPKVAQVLKLTDGVLQCGATQSSPGDLFRAEVCETLKAERLRFRSCQNCGRAFIARKRQAYCAARCSQAIRSRTFQKKHRTRLRESRRRTYERKVKAVHGQHVKVGIRRRKET